LFTGPEVSKIDKFNYHTSLANCILTNLSLRLLNFVLKTLAKNYITKLQGCHTGMPRLEEKPMKCLCRYHTRELIAMYGKPKMVETQA
jgi:hypothetical protein